MKIADNVYYVGVSNPTLRVFDIIMCTEYGTTYNSYLVKGADKTALIDGAHKGFEANFQENVEAITDFANIDYMVVNHTEPDHSGAIRLVIEKNPDIVVYGTAACLKNLDNIVRLPFNRVAVKDGDTLELGGKSPCIVDETANLRVAARRLAFGKLLNCGQTCVAPDYLLISRKVKDAFLPLLEREIQRMVGENALVGDSYVHMVNEKHFRRVCGLIDPDKVIFGGQADERTLRIQPTIMDRVTADDAVMQEEIFGPLLPVIAYDSIDEALAFVNGREHPLALYLFSEDPALQKRVLASVPFGGGCINDTIIHLATTHMPFGGVGNSGMGSYHGKKSFDTFTHARSIVKKSTWLDLPMRYHPYSEKKLGIIKRFMK